jgi:hypothetical protein
MQKLLLLPLSTLLLSGPLAAQDYVSPSHFTNAEGPSNNVFPFGHLIPFRYVQVHDDVPVMVVSRLSFRHDGTSSASGTGVIHPAHAVTMDAWLSMAATTSATIVAAFDGNHGANKTQVVTGRQYNHPASIPAEIPQPFLLDYPLDVPFPFTGGSLCWEAHVTARVPQSTSIPHDAVSMSSVSANPGLQVDTAFTGCISTGRTVPMRADGSSAMSWPVATGTLTVTVKDAQANGVILHVLGFRKTNWAGIPLPFLLPGSATAPSGPCHLYADVWVIQARQASATGDATLTLPVPATPDLNGLVAYSQVWGVDAQANPIGITMSNLVIHGFTAPFTSVPIGRVFLIGGLGANGTRGLNYGLVTRFR